jgi:hypothetical protein
VVDGVDPTLVDEREWLTSWGYRGSRRPLAIGDTTDPARTWTTIATGEPPDVHGIHAIEGRRVAGVRGMLTAEDSASGRALRQAMDLVRLSRTSLSSRNERNVMTFWEVAEAAGLRTKVVNWWATWPAVTLNGTVLSDRAILRLEHGGQDLYPRLRQIVQDDPGGLGRRVRVEMLKRFGYFPTESSEHSADLVPWFLPHEDQVRRFRIPVNDYLHRSERNLGSYAETRRRLTAGEPLGLGQPRADAAEEPGLEVDLIAHARHVLCPGLAGPDRGV